MKNKYKIYTDVKKGQENWVEILSPFLGCPDKNPLHPDFGRFERFRNKGLDFLEITKDPSSSDVFVYSKKWSKNDKKLESFLLLAKEKNKKTLVFYNDDSSEDLKLENKNVILFRTSFYKSNKKNYEESFPGWSNDPGGFLPRKKEKIPTVGFCGCVNNNVHRFTALKNISGDFNIIDNFILYDRFYAGWGDGIRPSSDFEYASKVKSQFINNIKNSDYVLCCRGAGNFSYRLYETLSCGRIPIIIDTDIVLPHENIIPWKEISVWINSRDVSKTSEMLLDYHEKMSELDFLNVQKSCRLIYENFIRPTEFFKVWFKNNFGDKND